MTARIIFTGDIMCAPGVTELATKDGKRDYSPMLAELEPYLEGADLVVGNLETPIAGEELEFTHERYCFNSPDEFAEMLKERGFGLLCLANNHCMDRGEEGIERTLDPLDRLGFATIGLNRPGEKRYRVLDVDGIKIGFVNYTYGTNAFAHHRFLNDPLSGRVCLFQPEETKPGSIHLLESAELIASEVDRLYNKPSDEYDAQIAPYLTMLAEDIAAAKRESDFVIAVMHSGGQYNPEPEAYTRMITAKLRELGADLIVGHHPHVIHSCEFVDNVFTAYSLGNLCCLPSICQDPDGAAHSALLTVFIEKNDGVTRLSNFDVDITETVEVEGSVPITRVVEGGKYERKFTRDLPLH